MRLYDTHLNQWELLVSRISEDLTREPEMQAPYPGGSADGSYITDIKSQRGSWIDSVKSGLSTVPLLNRVSVALRLAQHWLAYTRWYGEGKTPESIRTGLTNEISV